MATENVEMKTRHTYQVSEWKAAPTLWDFLRDPFRKLCRTGKGPLVGFAAEGLGCLGFEFWGFRFVFVGSGFLGLLGFRYLGFFGVLVGVRCLGTRV